MAALRWAALNLWSSHDTARDDPLFPDAKERMTLLEDHVAAGRRPALCGNQPFSRMRSAAKI